MSERELKFRYVWQHDETGRLLIQYYSIDQIQNTIFDFEGWSLIARNDFTGLKGDDGGDVYEGDFVETISGTFEVEWNDDKCCYQFSNGEPLNDGETYGEWKVVVGNIFETPKIRQMPEQAKETI